MSKPKEKKWSKHGRSHSSEQSANLQSTFMESRGWLEAVPSRSLDRKQRDSPKDMLGAVSDEDILKLTQLTAEVTTELKQPKPHRHRQEQDDKKKTTSYTPDSTDGESTRHSEKSSSIKTSSIQKEDRRRSWLYKSILKPIKSKGKAKEVNEEDSKTPASAFIDEFYQKQRQQQQQQQQQQLQEDEDEVDEEREASNYKDNILKINTTQAVSSSTSSNNSSINRRHSFDSVQSLQQPKPIRDSKLDKILHPFPHRHHHHHHHHKQISTTKVAENKEKARETGELVKTEEEAYKRPDFHLVVSHDDDGREGESEEDEEEGEENEANIPLEPVVVENALSDDESQIIDDQTILMFDYDSLPPEVRGLIDEYSKRGKVQIKEMIVKDSMSAYTDMNDEDEEDEEEEDDSILLAKSGNIKEKEGKDKNEEKSTIELDSDENTKHQNGDEEEEKDEIVYLHQLISGGLIPNNNKKRKIAIVTTSKYDDIEFTKLIQLDNDTTNGPLIDVHVSLFEMNYDSDVEGPREEFQYMLKSIEDRISSLEYLKKESREFLNEHQKSIRKLNLESVDRKPISRTFSYPNLVGSAPTVGIVPENNNNDSYTTSTVDEPDSLSDDGLTQRTTNVIRRRHTNQTVRYVKSMYIPETSLKDPFEYRKEELTHLIDGLKYELKGFRSCLEDTEKLVKSVQVDIDDTRNRMETYIKDIPQSHYSALKTLEVDIDSILSKRAKNPWLDTGYTLLSYLLTLFALVVWIIIYLLKLGKKVLFFPKKLWHSYSDYLLQRNRLVRNASLRSVSHYQ